jgi:hypothetical protein
MTPDNKGRRARRGAVWCAAIGITGLAALAFAYWFSYEPAPGIRVMWQPGVTLEQQTALERKYMLSNRRAPHLRSLAYDLLDTRRSNIEALVKDPAVVDTNDIEDQWARVRLGTAYGDRWMWVAHRTPLLRYGWLRWTLITVLTAMALFGVGGLLARQAVQKHE